MITPITDCNYFLSLHSIIIPFLVFHWMINNNMCVISVLEKSIGESVYGKDYKKDDCFSCRLIEPVYDFKNNNEHMSNFIYSIVLIVWLISMSKLVHKCYIGNITKYMDFFKL